MKPTHAIIIALLMTGPLLTVAQEVKINTGSYIVVNGNVSLILNNASFKNNGTFIPGTGEVKFTGNVDTTTAYISGNSTTIFNKLRIDKTAYGVTFKSPVSVKDSLNIIAGNLFTDDQLTLKSDTAITASIGKLPVDGSNNATSLVTGIVTMERYFSSGKAWHLLGVPIKTSGSPTINAVWQEGLTTASGNPNLYPGYGVHIMGGTTANGFDQSPTNASSIRIYNNSTNTLTALPASPGTNIAISNYPGYFLYIRGDRSINLMQGTSAAITATTLRMKGQVKTGIQTIPVAAANYTLISNPYPSTIDFHTTTKSNVPDMFYLWDPKLSGSYGLGGYVTMVWNSGSNSYDATTSVSPVSRYIQAGEAIFVKTTDGVSAGSISFNEADKRSADIVARPGGSTQKLRSNLYVKETDGSYSLLDAVLTTYDNENLNVVDNNDAVKLNGSCESIGIKRDTKMLAIERRTTITENDTCFLNLYNMRIKNYKLEIVAENLNSIGTIALLKDKYSSVNNDLPINMNGTTNILFDVNSDPASYDINRFSIEFNFLAPVPVSFRTLKAYQQERNIAVEWTVENEIDIRNYDVEKSADGFNFSKINTTAAKASNGGAANYQFIDINPFKGNNFYRVRSVSKNEKINYSGIVKVNMIQDMNNQGYTIYPNPIKGNTITILFANQEPGAYQLKLMNNIGQVLYSETMSNNSINNTGSFTVKNKLAAGIYDLEIKSPSNKTETKKLIVQ